jgi:hypothetical protein
MTTSPRIYRSAVRLRIVPILATLAIWTLAGSVKG